MMSLTQNERDALLLLFKDFTSFYNANSISKILNISHVGAQKIFKRLLKENLVVRRVIGKSIIYALDYSNDYAGQLMVFLLADEANKFKRWKAEFKEVSGGGRIVMIYGSAVKDYSRANDVDLMVVLNDTGVKDVDAILKKTAEILPKPLHVIKLSNKDLADNLRKKDKVVIDIVKNAVVLYGQDDYVGILKDVAGI